MQEKNKLAKQLEQIYQDFGGIADKMESIIESIDTIYGERYDLSEIEDVLMLNFSSDMSECRDGVIGAYDKYKKLVAIIKVINEE